MELETGLEPVDLIPVGIDKVLRQQIQHLTYLHLASLYVTFITLTYFFSRHRGFIIERPGLAPGLTYFLACLVGQIVLMVGVSRLNTLLLSDRNKEDLYTLCLFSLFFLITAGIYLGACLLRARP